MTAQFRTRVQIADHKGRQQDYLIERQPAQAWRVNAWAIWRVGTPAASAYVTTDFGDDVWQCTCADFHYRHRLGRGECKHIDCLKHLAPDSKHLVQDLKQLSQGLEHLTKALEPPIPKERSAMAVTKNGTAVTKAMPAAVSPLAINTLADLQQLGEILFKSGYFSDVKSAAQAVVKLMVGRELGFREMASLAGVHVIEGKPSVGAHLLAASIKRSGKYDYAVLQRTRECCELQFKELRGSEWLNLTPVIKCELKDFTQSADPNVTGPAMTWKKIGGKDTLVMRDNWAKTPDDMLFARAISKGYKTHCPDLTGGTLVYVEGEIEQSEPPQYPPILPTRPPAIADQAPTAHAPLAIAPPAATSPAVSPQSALPLLPADQVLELETLIVQAQADRKAFLGYYGCDRIEGLSPLLFPDAKAKLANKIQKLAREGQAATPLPQSPVTPATAQPPPAKASAETLAKIEAMTAELRIATHKFSQRLTEMFGHSSLTALTQEQAQVVLDNLHKAKAIKMASVPSASQVA